VRAPEGGFVIFDDFAESRGGGPRSGAFRRVLPEAPSSISTCRTRFHSFFEIGSFDILPQNYDVGRPILRAVFEHNDPTKRMMAMINFNTDISEYWEESGHSLRPVWETTKPTSSCQLHHVWYDALNRFQPPAFQRSASDELTVHR
jgi:hypothetical protein